jgi:flavoprotein
LFSDSDVAALGSKSSRSVQRVFNVAQKLSGLSDEDIDELAKNSESDPDDSSTSVLLGKSDAQ